MMMEELKIKPPPVPPPAPDIHLKKVVPQIAKNSAKEAKKAKIKKAPAKQKKSKSKSSRNVVRTKDQIHIILDSGHGGIDPGAVKGDPKKVIEFMRMMLFTTSFSECCQN